MNYRILVKRNIELIRCPNCNEIATLKKTRSHNFLYKILKLFSFQNYICRSCGWKGNFYAYRKSKNAEVLIGLYIALMAFSGFVVYYILKTFFK